MIKEYDIIITDIYKFQYIVEAESPNEAIRKAKEYYQRCEDGSTGVADARSHVETRFAVQPEGKEG